MFSEPLSPPLSFDPNSLPYYDLTSNFEHSSSDNPDPTSSNHEELQAITDSKKTQSIPEPSETIPEPSEPILEPSEPIPGPSKLNLTIPPFDEALAKFLESYASKFKKLSDECSINENPFELRTHWNGFIRWMNSEFFKLKDLSE